MEGARYNCARVHGFRLIVLECMDLDYALRMDQSSDLTSASIAE